MAGPRRSVRYARRAWPLILAAYRRWERLTPEERARYQKTVRDAVERGRRVVRERGPAARKGVKGRRGGKNRKSR
jgi:hypothetical protein